MHRSSVKDTGRTAIAPIYMSQRSISSGKSANHPEDEDSRLLHPVSDRGQPPTEMGTGGGRVFHQPNQTSSRMKLLTYPALARSQKIIVVSELAGIKLEVDTNVTAEQLKAAIEELSVVLQESA